MRPSVGVVGEEVYAALEPLASVDSSYGWPLLLFAGALAAPVEDIAALVRDSAAGPGWSAAVDVDRCPDFALPWLAQCNGTVLTPGMTADEQRAAIKDEPGFRRGTLGAIVAAAQKTLTGAKQVLVKERDGGAYKLTVHTFTSETADTAATEAAIRAQKPAGIILTYSAIDGSDFELVRLAYTTFADLTSAHSTFGDLATDGPT